MFIETSACENSQVDLAFQRILNGMADPSDVPYEDAC